MNIECSPEKVWPFLGLPDSAPMQEELLQEYPDRDRVRVGVGKLAPEAYINCWFSVIGGNWLELQKTLWLQYAGTPPKE